MVGTHYPRSVRRRGYSKFNASNIYKKKTILLLSSSSLFFDFFIFAQFWSDLSLFCTKKRFFPFKTVSESVVLSQKCLCLIAAIHFFITWFEVAIYCLPFDGLFSMCALLQKARKRTKSVNQTVFTSCLEPNHLSTRRNSGKRKKREEIVESERAVGELARQAASL